MTDSRKAPTSRSKRFETVVPENRPKPGDPLLCDEAREIRVEVMGGPMDGHRVTVQGPALSIGRSPDNDLGLALDPMVSSTHARILHEEDRYWLEDLGSRNGTFLGGQQIRERTPIGPGTVFTVGQTALEFTPR